MTADEARDRDTDEVENEAGAGGPLDPSEATTTSSTAPETRNVEEEGDPLGANFA